MARETLDHSASGVCPPFLSWGRVVEGLAVARLRFSSSSRVGATTDGRFVHGSVESERLQFHKQLRLQFAVLCHKSGTRLGSLVEDVVHVLQDQGLRRTDFP